jgi:8-oxo-dGTP pyrophosphatase MutT (NUDIX family)
VSVKGVVIRDDSVILVRNGRDEWELPGGKLELSESPEQCLVREIVEELQLEVVPETILDSWLYSIASDVHVLVITYGCVESSEATAVLSAEHSDMRWFPVSEIGDLNMPGSYKASIQAWAEQRRRHNLQR